MCFGINSAHCPDSDWVTMFPNVAVDIFMDCLCVYLFLFVLVGFHFFSLLSSVSYRFYSSSFGGKIQNTILWIYFWITIMWLSCESVIVNIEMIAHQFSMVTTFIFSVDFSVLFCVCVGDGLSFFFVSHFVHFSMANHHWKFSTKHPWKFDVRSPDIYLYPFRTSI